MLHMVTAIVTGWITHLITLPWYFDDTHVLPIINFVLTFGWMGLMNKQINSMIKIKKKKQLKVAVNILLIWCPFDSTLIYFMGLLYYTLCGQFTNTNFLLCEYSTNMLTIFTLLWCLFTKISCHIFYLQLSILSIPFLSVIAFSPTQYCDIPVIELQTLDNLFLFYSCIFVKYWNDFYIRFIIMLMNSLNYFPWRRLV